MIGLVFACLVALVFSTDLYPVNEGPSGTYKGSDTPYSAGKFPITDVWYVGKGDKTKLGGFGMCYSSDGILFTYQRASKAPAFFVYGPIRLGYMGDRDTADLEIHAEFVDSKKASVDAEKGYNTSGTRYVPYQFTSVLFGSSYLSGVGQSYTELIGIPYPECQDSWIKENGLVDYENFLTADKTGSPFAGYNEKSLNPFNFVYCHKQEGDVTKTYFHLPMKYKKFSANGAAVHSKRDYILPSYFAAIKNDLVAKIRADLDNTVANAAAAVLTEPEQMVVTFKPFVDAISFVSAIAFRSSGKYYDNVDVNSDQIILESVIAGIAAAGVSLGKTLSAIIASRADSQEQSTLDALVGTFFTNGEIAKYCGPTLEQNVVDSTTKVIKTLRKWLDVVTWPEYVSSSTIKSDWPRWADNKDWSLGPKEGQRISVQFMDMVISHMANNTSAKVQEVLKSEGWDISISDNSPTKKVRMCVIDYTFDYDIGLDVWTIVVASSIFLAGLILVCIKQFKCTKKVDYVDVEPTNAVGGEVNVEECDNVEEEVALENEEIVPAVGNVEIDTPVATAADEI